VLAKAGVNVFDPSTILAEMKKRSGEDVCRKTDSHWSAPAMEHVAAQLATWLRERDSVPTVGPVDWQARKRAVCNAGASLRENQPQGWSDFEWNRANEL